MKPKLEFIMTMTPTDYLTTVGAFGLLVILLELLVALGCFGFWLYALIHCIKNRHDADRLMWVIVTFAGGPVGAAVYMAMGRQKPPPVGGSNARATPPPPPMPIPKTPAGSAPPGAGHVFDHEAMHDEKKRAQAINDALSAMSASKNRR